jgi:cell wall-associated NlpC family hydrolase
MTHVLGALLLGDVARFAIRLAAGLLLAVLLALAFALASTLTLFYGVVPAALSSAPSPLTAGSDRTVPPPGGPEASAVALARAFVGTPYVWGGADPRTGFDCSGLVQWAYGRAGLDLPRTANQQYLATHRVSPVELRPGDLVFFARTYNAPPSEWITHVGIYVGGGRMLNAPVEGDVVREMDVFTGFWGAHYAGAGRVGGAAQ